MSERDARADAEHWHAALRLYESLLDLPEDARAGALARADAAPEARERAARMLAQDGRPGLLDRPLPLQLLPGAAAQADADALIGRRLGRWLLLDRLGQGGMATVYRARSLQPPLDQIAALKLLSLAAATPAGRARFEREIDILVRLRHPGIAPVFDAGIAADGTPWFAMALIEGVSIDAWCQEQGLGLDQRVALLLQVCDAVEHAHRHLVIHRDIKPGNVLVDRDGRAVLLDFGISRLLDDAATRSGEGYAFTPRFAAPEQLSGGDISTASDVFSLACLLHALLLGAPPQWPEGEGECRDPAALARRDADRALRHALRGDLGHVLRRALARDPARRYPTVAAFAADLRAWREGRPVAARKGGSAYRLRRFVARHAWATVLTAACVVALVAATLVAFAQRQEALRQSARAEASAASSMRQLAFLREFMTMLVPSNEEEAALQRDAIIDEAVRRAEAELADDPFALAAVKHQLGDSYRRIHRLDAARRQYADARALLERRRGDVEATRLLDALAVSDAHALSLDPDALDAADAAYRRALRALDPRDAADLPVWLEAKTGYSVLLGNRSRFDEALREAVDAATACPQTALPSSDCLLLAHQQGVILQKLGKPEAALPLLEAAASGLGVHHPQLQTKRFEVARTLATVYGQLGRHDPAIALLQDVLAGHARISDRPTVESVNARIVLARALRNRARHAEADAALALATQEVREVFGERSIHYSNALSELGNLRYALGQWQPALQAYRDSHAIAVALHGGEHAAVAIAEGNIGNALRDAGNAAEALRWQRAATDRLARTLGKDSRRYASRLSNLARTELALGRPQAARVHFDQALALYRRHGGDDDFAPYYILANRALVRAAQGEQSAARDDALSGLAGLTQVQGETAATTLEALSWALRVHCGAPASAHCAALRDRGQALLRASADALPPLERDLVRQALRVR